jgi:hypothetical protein
MKVLFSQNQVAIISDPLLFVIDSFRFHNKKSNYELGLQKTIYNNYIYMYQ